MCTALTFCTKDHYFGRTLDLEYHYDERVVITPRAFPLPFRKMGVMQRHYAMIGMATVVDGYPLYYDATNEQGLSVAGLNFPGNAFYPEEVSGLILRKLMRTVYERYRKEQIQLPRLRPAKYHRPYSYQSPEKV